MTNKDVIIARLLEQVQLLTEQNLQLHTENQERKRSQIYCMSVGAGVFA